MLKTEPQVMFVEEKCGGAESLLCPYPRCEVCGEKITDAHHAVAVMERSSDPETFYSGHLVFRHTWPGPDCDQRVGGGGYWRKLDELLMQLCHNANVSPQKLRDVAGIIERKLVTA